MEQHDRLGVDTTVKETKLQKLQKDCKLLHSAEKETDTGTQNNAKYECDWKAILKQV